MNTTDGLADSLEDHDDRRPKAERSGHMGSRLDRRPYRPGFGLRRPGGESVAQSLNERDGDSSFHGIRFAIKRLPHLLVVTATLDGLNPT